jgi:Flp pilus assembly pilin Flp
MKKFLKDESGAVTVDFVVLTAGAVLIALTVGSALATKVTTAVSNIDLDSAVTSAGTQP